MDITIGNRSQATGRFNFVRGEDGDVAFDETEAHAVMTSVIEKRGSYWADPEHGSDLFTLKNLTTRTPSQAEAMALEAVLPLEEANAISNVAARARAVRDTGRLELELAWQAPGSEETNTATVEV